MALRHSWFPGSIQSPSRVPPRSISTTQETYSRYSYPPGSSTTQDGGTLPEDFEMNQFTANIHQSYQAGVSTNPTNNSGITQPVPLAQHSHHPPYQHSDRNGEGNVPDGQAAMNKQPSLEQMKMTPQVPDRSPHPAAAEEGGAHQKTPKRTHHGPKGNGENDQATFCINFCVKARDGC
jgi:hypothetical protein